MKLQITDVFTLLLIKSPVKLPTLMLYNVAGNFSSFMQKEIFEQPESVMNTMRGRMNFAENKVVLGGIMDYMNEIRRCRRVLFIACGTSWHSAIAVSTNNSF